MTKADSAHTTSLSRRRFIAATTATAVAAIPSALKAGAATTEISVLYQAWLTQRRVCSDAYDAYDRAACAAETLYPCPAPEICVANLPTKFVEVIKFHDGPAMARDMRGGTEWMWERGWEFALRRRVVWPTVPTVPSETEIVGWLTHRRELAKQHRAATEQIQRETGASAAGKACDVPFDKLDEIENALLIIPAKSLADLQMQARVLQQRRDDELDIDSRHAGVLISSILAMHSHPFTLQWEA